MSNQAFKSGYCDAIMGREAQAPKTWQHAPAYMKGYFAGQESGVLFVPPAPECKQDITKALQRVTFLQGLSASSERGGFMG